MNTLEEAEFARIQKQVQADFDNYDFIHQQAAYDLDQIPEHDNNSQEVESEEDEYESEPVPKPQPKPKKPIVKPAVKPNVKKDVKPKVVESKTKKQEQIDLKKLVKNNDLKSDFEENKRNKNTVGEASSEEKGENIESKLIKSVRFDDKKAEK